MPIALDITNQRFNCLVALCRVPNKGTRVYWKFKCDCGNIKDILSYNVTSGHTLSCGCVNKILHSTITQGNKLNLKHGMTKSKIYNVWSSMKKRCLNPKHKAFKDYGGRGIAVCIRWLESFENFLEDMGDVPFIGAQLDRINNDGNYEPSNCRWVTSKENCNNRRKPIIRRT